jgi:ABC-type multidrug transport system fused ATPase/permease subunit
VGSTGSGKTTSVDIILGLLEPQEGSLKIDGKLITNANRRQWQGAIGYVPQHIYLSDDTVVANIAFGVSVEDVDLKAVVRAAKVANLHDFVTDSLPEGYSTKVGERGVRLSGGQRQRIAIARAILKNAPIIILDEATSSLDTATENEIQQSIYQLLDQKNTTVIAIAHRLSTIRHMDRIVVMDAGQVIEDGTFEDLMSREKGYFKRLWDTQVNGMVL